MSYEALLTLHILTAVATLAYLALHARTLLRAPEQGAAPMLRVLSGAASVQAASGIALIVLSPAISAISLQLHFGVYFVLYAIVSAMLVRAASGSTMREARLPAGVIMASMLAFAGTMLAGL